MPADTLAAKGMPWWIAVYVPSSGNKSADNLFKITRVNRFQALCVVDAINRADRIQSWRLVSIAQEMHVVY
jgi:hypothetical protein